MRYASILSLCWLIAGCATGREDWQKPIKPCQVWIIQQPENTALCVSRDEWNRYWKPILIPQ